ncbi:hypothetical protein F4777DRAFT_563872 [Nemania sp. FL0916]|nr:hypothetical protein F4777DRAFT_563872 [Nemania sp. FL0916]
MPLSREPSQRALNWVKRSTSKTGSNSSHNSKRVTEPEIIHLGGSRVGTAFEVLDLPAPDRSNPNLGEQRPLTQWTFDPPPPNPPGIGIALASPSDNPMMTANGSHLDSNDRPITQWFPEFQVGVAVEKKTKPEPQQTAPAMRTTSPYLNPTPDAVSGGEDLASPLSFTSSSNATPISPAGAGLASSPAYSPIPSPMDMESPGPNQNQPQNVQFPKRSTSLSKASRYVRPRLPGRGGGAGGAENTALLAAKEVHLRRTQSNAEGTAAAGRPGHWRPAPPQLVIHEKRDGGLPIRLVSPPSSHDGNGNGNRQEREQFNKSPRRSPIPITMRGPQDAQGLPLLPPTSPPPNAPLPLVVGTKLAGHGKAREQVQVQGQGHTGSGGQSSSPGGEPGVERSAAPVVEVQIQEEEEDTPLPQPQQPQQPQLQLQLQQPQSAAEQQHQQKLTPKERLWLHRHYRGEAGFLNAWGLQIGSEEDRGEGRTILRELMAGEQAEEENNKHNKEKETQERQRTHHRSGSGAGSQQSRSSTATNASTSTRDGVGLDVITEERHSREVEILQPRAMTPLGNARYSDGEREIRGQGQGQRMKNQRPGLDSHARNESTDSVLEQYLDLRLSHIT